jgi:HK97 family phage portal protein
LGRQKKTRQPIEKMEVSAGPSPVSRPISWLSGGNTASKVQVTEQSAMSLATVYACVNKIATTCANFPLHLYAEDDKDNIQRIRKHNLVTLLDRPNRFQTAFEWRQFVFTCLALRGNSFNYVYRENGYAKALMPLHPDNVTVFVAGTGADRELFYQVRFPESGETLDLSADECLHYRVFGTSPYIGSDPLTLAKESLGLAIAERQHAARVFANGISASGVLTTPQKLKPEQRNEIKADWDRNHSGESAHKLAILEGGWTFQPLSISDGAANFIESMKFSDESICRLFGVTPTMVGFLDRAGVTSVEQLNRSFYDTGLLPYLRNFEQRTDQTLLTTEERDRKGLYTAHDANHFLGADVKSRYSSYATAIQWGWMSPNEARSREDMSPYEGGDVYLKPLNMAPVGSTEPNQDNQGAN